MNEQQTQNEETGETMEEQVSQAPGALRTQVLWHGGALFISLAAWAAGDAWFLLTGLGLAAVYSVLAGFVFALVWSHVFHEWGHFLGARLSGAGSVVKAEPAPLMFDFDYAGSNQHQFLRMSMGGTLGNLAFIAFVALALPLDSHARAMVMATALGMLAYVAVVEFPVIRRVAAGGQPLEVLTEVFAPERNVLQRAAWLGLFVGIGSWLLML